jgi:rhodanese-related sulfurtransferase
MSIVNLSASDLAEQIAQGKVMLIDVREANEHATGIIAGAACCPLSCLNPTELPKPQPGQTVVLYCAGGVRSAKALAACNAAGLGYDTHLAGGINAWKAAGLPIST